jgi:hypothetical protein
MTTHPTLRSIRPLISCGVFLAVGGCGAGRADMSDAQQNEALCAAAAKKYEVMQLQDYEASPVGDSAGWYAWADFSSGSTPSSVSVQEIEEEGGNCSHTKALVFDSGSGHNDYGSGFGPGPKGDMCGAPQQACTVDSDCPAGTACKANACAGSQECTYSSDCPSGVTCDQATKTCVPCKWDGLGFWVRIPQGSDPTISMSLNDYQTGGQGMGTVDRECCSGDNCKTFNVPLRTCYTGADTPTWLPACDEFNRIEITTNACQSVADCPGSDVACPQAACVSGICRKNWACATCTDTITPVPMPPEQEAGWGKVCADSSECPGGLACTDGKCVATPIPASDCSKANVPAYAKSRCEKWAYLSSPLVCDPVLTTDGLRVSPPLDVWCAGWTFLVTAKPYWTFVSVPFEAMIPDGVDIGGGVRQSGAAFDKLDSRYVTGMVPRIGNAEAHMKFWVDEIDLYDTK